VITVIDNYDSFTWNLVQQIERLSGRAIRVVRNDAFEVGQLLEERPAAIVISPGPGTPERAGLSMEVVRRAGSIPVLGVCLGHQAIAAAFGGQVVRGPVPVHGKTSRILHDGGGLFADCPRPMEGARYHSLVVDRESLPPELTVDAETDDGLIMGMSHRGRPLFGVQFHPESYGTRCGDQLILNFLRLGGLS